MESLVEPERQHGEEPNRRDRQQLREREREWRVLIENLSSGVALLDSAGRFVLTNSRFLQMFGLAPDSDVNAQDWHAWQVCDDRGQFLERDERPWHKAASSLVPVHNQMVGVRAPGGGDIVWMLISAAPLLGRDGRLENLICTYHETTEFRRAQDALREADQQKNAFLAVLSHELRNSLTPVRNSLYIMDKICGESDQVRRAMAVMDRQISQMTRLTDDLLDVTRISRGKIRLGRESVDLNEIVRATGEDHRVLFRNNGINLQVMLASRPVRVSVDKTRVAQVIGNLLQNAAKFTPRGGRVLLVLENTGQQAIVKVRDSGVGLDARVLDRLFEPFVQVQATMDRSKGGLGLGLALVKGLIELHGGTVAARSEGLGKGAEFEVRLPLEANQQRIRTPASLEEQRSPFMRILIIEDNADAAESLKEALELSGYEVETARTGLDGIDKARVCQPDVVLCDLGLPGLDGFEVARRLRADPTLGSVTLIALSGYASPEDVARSREAGFHNHLAKPADLATLEKVLARAKVWRPTGGATGGQHAA
jgi:PAS domain S-box-containing protein